MIFEHHEFTTEQKLVNKTIIAAVKFLYGAIDVYCQDSLEKSLAKTNLEQAIMWANKCIAIYDQENRNVFQISSQQRDEGRQV